MAWEREMEVCCFLPFFFLSFSFLLGGTLVLWELSIGHTHYS